MSFYETLFKLRYKEFDLTPFGRSHILNVSGKSDFIDQMLFDDLTTCQAFFDAKNELQNYIDTANLTASSKNTNSALSESKKYLPKSTT